MNTHGEPASTASATCGEQSALVFRNTDDPNNLVLLFGWDNLDNARRYAQDPRLKAAMQEAGISEPPQIVFLEQA